jgi:hypothetical protein
LAELLGFVPNGLASVSPEVFRHQPDIADGLDGGGTMPEPEALGKLPNQGLGTRDELRSGILLLRIDIGDSLLARGGKLPEIPGFRNAGLSPAQVPQETPALSRRRSNSSAGIRVGSGYSKISPS